MVCGSFQAAVFLSQSHLDIRMIPVSRVCQFGYFLLLVSVDCRVACDEFAVLDLFNSVISYLGILWYPLYSKILSSLWGVAFYIRNKNLTRFNHQEDTIELRMLGMSAPVYTNISFPFTPLPMLLAPYVPHDNPTGGTEREGWAPIEGCAFRV